MPTKQEAAIKTSGPEELQFESAPLPDVERPVNEETKSASVKTEQITEQPTPLENQSAQERLATYEAIMKQVRETFSIVKMELSQKTQEQVVRLSVPDNQHRVADLKKQITLNLNGNFLSTFRLRHGRLDKVRHAMLELETIRHDFRIEKTEISNQAKSFFVKLMTNEEEDEGGLKLSAINTSKLALGSVETEQLANELAGFKAELTEWLKAYQAAEPDHVLIDEQTYTDKEMEEYTIGMRDLIG